MMLATHSFSSLEPELNLVAISPDLPISPPERVAKLGNLGTKIERWRVWVLWTSPEAQEHI